MAGDTDDEAATACTVFAAKHEKTCSDHVADILYSGCTGRTLCQVCSFQSHIPESRRDPYLQGACSLAGKFCTDRSASYFYFSNSKSKCPFIIKPVKTCTIPEREEVSP